MCMCMPYNISALWPSAPPEVRREVREVVGRRISTLFRSECRGDCHVNVKDILFSFHYHLPDAKFQNASPLKNIRKKKKIPLQYMREIHCCTILMTPPRKARPPPPSGMTSRFNTRDFRGVGVVLAYWHRWLSVRASVVVVNNLLAVYSGCYRGGGSSAHEYRRKIRS